VLLNVTNLSTIIPYFCLNKGFGLDYGPDGQMHNSFSQNLRVKLKRVKMEINKLSILGFYLPLKLRTVSIGVEK
jgi:hypothetical protein